MKLLPKDDLSDRIVNVGGRLGQSRAFICDGNDSYSLLPRLKQLRSFHHTVLWDYGNDPYRAADPPSGPDLGDHGKRSVQVAELSVGD